MRQDDPTAAASFFVGPLPIYQQAQALKGRYAAVYPDAIIVP